MAIKALWKFIGERFPLPVTVPIAAVLVLGTSHWLQGGVGKETPLCLVKTFLAFLILRIADDLSDLEFDRRLKPGRGLCSGTISEKGLTRGLSVLSGCFLFPTRGSKGDILLLGGFVAYSFFYRIKTKIPFFIRTFFVNVIFLLLPVYISLQAGSEALWPPLMLGGFLWLAAAAHEYTHSLGEEETRHSTYEYYFSGRTQAILGTIGFFLALLFGMQFAIATSKRMFLFALAPWSLVISVFCIRLIRDPSPSNAQPFYVHGFLFFLVPLLLSLFFAFIA